MEIDAAVLHAPNEVSVERVSLDGPGVGEVLVDVEATGVCATDYHRYTGTIDVPVPVVLGHEGAGTVEALGDGVQHLSPGDSVVLFVAPSCGSCRPCDSGEPMLCENSAPTLRGRMLDGTRRLRFDGSDVNHFFGQSSFATKAVVPAHSAIRIPGDLPPARACLLGCGVSTALGAVFHVGDVRPGESVAVFGCGGLGTSAIMAAAATGADPIVAVDVHEAKLETAGAVGATHRVNAAADDPVDAISGITGDGADHTFEFVGNTDVMEQAVRSVCPGGICVISGETERGDVLEIDASDLLFNRSIHGNLAGATNPRRDIPRYAKMHQQGVIDLDALVSREYPLAEIETALASIEDEEIVRTVVRQ